MLDVYKIKTENLDLVIGNNFIMTTGVENLVVSLVMKPTNLLKVTLLHGCFSHF